MKRWSLLLSIALTTISGQSRDLRVTDQEQLLKAAGSARPGDRLILSGGPFRNIHLSSLRGTTSSPIVIQGLSAKEPAIFRGGKTGLQLSGCSGVTLRYLDVSGASLNGVNIDDAGRKDQPARHITIEDCKISHIGPKGNHDGLKLSGLAEFVVRRCRFNGWGGSAIDLVGCRDGQIVACHIEGAEGHSQNSGIQLKGGTCRVRVTGSFFLHAGQRAINLGGSTGLEFFRPKVREFEAEEIEIAGNRFVGGTTPVAWVTSRAGHVHHNTIYLPEKWVGRILQENAEHGFKPVQNGVFEYNLVVFDGQVGSLFNIGPATEPDTFVFRHNAWFDSSGRSRRPDLPGKVVDEIHGVDPRLVNPGVPTMRITSPDPRLQQVGADAHKNRP